MENELEISGLKVSVNSTMILNGIDLKVRVGELHVLMGPNGSGKSTLSNVIIGNPKYKVLEGEIKFNGVNLLKMRPDERARAGIFMSFQEPVEVPGINIFNFMRTAYLKEGGNASDLSALRSRMSLLIKELGLPENFIQRSINEGFSGGEKKRFEMLQMLLLSPKIAILDEVDSGLDFDTLKVIGNMISAASKDMGVLMITHSDRIFDHLKPDFIHIIKNGRIISTGGLELVSRIKKEGYDSYN